MPSTTEDRPMPRVKASAKYENLTPFEAALIDMQGERDIELLGEFRGMRKDIAWMFRAGGIGTFTLIAFLIAGVMIMKGIDPATAAGATKTVVETASGSVSVETKKADPVEE